MTREEAISRLKKGAPFSEIYDSSWDEALNMAINSLEVDEQYQLEYEEIKPISALSENNGDLISRQAVLELIADYDLSMGQVVKGIHALPSVEYKAESEDKE